MVLETAEALDSRYLERALDALESHHDVLRSAFTKDGDAWRQVIQPPGRRPTTVGRIDWTGLTPAQETAEIDRLEATFAGDMDLSAGDLLRAVLVSRDRDRPDLLVMAIHHLAVDGVSWWILLEDLETAYVQIAGGKDPDLGSKTSSIKAWSETLVGAGPGLVKRDRGYWAKLTGRGGDLPRDRGGKRQPDQIGIPGDLEPRAAHAAQRDHRLLRDHA